MNDEIINAAIMRLRSHALEHYGVIKDMCRRPPSEGLTDEIVKSAISLVQFEGAMLTLQQYVPTIKSELEEEAKAEKEAIEAEKKEKERLDQQETISEEELAKRSPTFRKTKKDKKKNK